MQTHVTLSLAENGFTVRRAVGEQKPQGLLYMLLRSIVFKSTYYSGIKVL